MQPLTEYEERSVHDSYDEGHPDIEHEAEAGEHSQASREHPSKGHPHLIPHIVKSTTKQIAKVKK